MTAALSGSPASAPRDLFAFRNLSVGGEKVVDPPDAFSREDAVPLGAADPFPKEPRESVLAVVARGEVLVAPLGGKGLVAPGDERSAPSPSPVPAPISAIGPPLSGFPRASVRT
jgi:hypothetical protein